MLSTSCVADSAPASVAARMSPTLQPLTLPQLAQDSKSRMVVEEHGVALDGPDLSYVYYTTNSSSSDVGSPLTPTFSTRGAQLRYSSSTSSLELPTPPIQQQLPLQQLGQIEGPASPIASSATLSKTSLRQLPDVQEDPSEHDEEEEIIHVQDDDNLSDNFGLYRCLCDQACEHGNSSEDFLRTEVVGEFDFDYDLGFLSDSDFSTDPQIPKKKRGLGGDSTLNALTSRFGSRFPSIARWQSQRKASIMTSPTTERSLENVFAGVPSSRSSSMSAPSRHFSVLQDAPLSANPTMSSLYESTDSLDVDSREYGPGERSGIERDRSMATTPLLPPLLTDPLGKPPQQSPLQSPTVAPSSAVTEVHSPRLPPAARPSPSTKSSVSSLRQVSVMAELPLPLPPSILQEQDEWSDRLGHANFTISPMPYDLDEINAETVTKFGNDWDAARVAYTKHLVRTGENYGQTSKIYALTEAKWAEIERRWKGIYTNIIRQTEPTAPAMAASRSRSRGRGRGRTENFTPANKGYSTQDDVFAAVQWQPMKDCLPSAVPQMLEALDAEGKFPALGDEDIVGPMQRDAFMARARSEESKTPRFWKSLTEKLRR